MKEFLQFVLTCGTQQTVDMTLYRCSLVGALALMIFFSVTFIFGRTPEKLQYRRYSEARFRFGLALLVLSANYAVHLFVAPRFGHAPWAILMNIDTYYLAAWLFGSSMLHLLVCDFNSPRRDLLNVGSWMVFCMATAAMLAIAPAGFWKSLVLIISSVLFMGYTFHIALLLLINHRRAVRLLDGYHSDDVAAYVRWVSVFTYLAMFYGVGQGVFTFLPDKYVFLWILSSIPFYAYGYISYVHYFIDVKKVDEVLVDDTQPELDSAGCEMEETADGAECKPKADCGTEPDGNDSVVGDRLSQWIAQGEFTRQGLTIVQLAQDICTNRTYVSAYINSHYHVSFREWINSLRLGYAKRLLAEEPSLSIGDVAQRVGYVSLSSFTRVFTTNEGISPGRWRRENSEAKM